MFDDNFARLDDRSEINRLIPLNELSKIAYELPSLGIPDS